MLLPPLAAQQREAAVAARSPDRVRHTAAQQLPAAVRLHDLDAHGAALGAARGSGARDERRRDRPCEHS